jgi:hypothetical protein
VTWTPPPVSVRPSSPGLNIVARSTTRASTYVTASASSGGYAARPSVSGSVVCEASRTCTRYTDLAGSTPTRSRRTLTVLALIAGSVAAQRAKHPVTAAWRYTLDSAWNQRAGLHVPNCPEIFSGGKRGIHFGKPARVHCPRANLRPKRAGVTANAPTLRLTRESHGCETVACCLRSPCVRKGVHSRKSARYWPVAHTWLTWRGGDYAACHETRELPSLREKSCGAPDWIRTSDLQLRRLPLYPTELRARWGGR